MLAACGEGILFERGCVRHRSILNYELLFAVGAGARKPPPRALAKAMSSTKPLRRSDVDCSRGARGASSTIQRESGGERACPIVKISVGAVTLKKKQATTRTRTKI